MNPKKLFPVLLIAVLSFAMLPSFAGDPVPVPTSEQPNAEAQTHQALTRLKEIRGMDKSSLTSVEKRELRKELRELKKETKERRNGIYLSVGAIILIAVLLILLL